MQPRYVATRWLTKPTCLCRDSANRTVIQTPKLCCTYPWHAILPHTIPILYASLLVTALDTGKAWLRLVWKAATNHWWKDYHYERLQTWMVVYKTQEGGRDGLALKVVSFYLDADVAQCVDSTPDLWPSNQLTRYVSHSPPFLSRLATKCFDRC